MIDFTPYLNDDRLPVMNTDQFNYITEKYGKEKFREELSEYISQARPPFPFKKISKQDMITNFLDLKSFDTSKIIKSKNDIEKTVFEKYDDYKYSFDEYGLGLIEGANTYNTVSNYFMQELRLNCGSYGFRAPVDVWQNGNAKDIWRCFGPIWRGINTNNTLDEKVYMSAFRLGTYIATQFKPVVAKAIYDLTNANKELQSWAKFNEYDKWRDDFFLPVSEQCIKKSKHTLINIMDPKIKGKRYRTGDELCDKYKEKFKGQIGMRIMQRPKSDKLFKDEQEKKEFMNNIFIENIWYFSNENTDLFKKSTLDEFFA